VVAVVVTSVVSGLSAAVRERRLVLVMWLLHLAVALIVVFPFWVWAQRALGTSVEAQALLGGLDLAVFADVLEESSPAIVMVALALLAVLVVAAAGAALVSGGVLAVLIGRARAAEAGAATGPGSSRERVLARFFEGGGRYFWRNLGLMAITAVALLVIGGLVFGLARAATAPLEDSLSEAGAWARTFAPVAAAGLVLVLLILVLDFARAALVAGDRRGVWRSWLAGARFVAGRLPAAGALWLAFGLLVVLGGGLYLAVQGLAPAGTWPAIWLMVLMQQAFVLWRGMMRVGLVAAQIHLATACRMPGFVEAPASPPPADARPLPPEPESVELASAEPSAATSAPAPSPAVLPPDDPRVPPAQS
jgi:hypothetical protein